MPRRHVLLRTRLKRLENELPGLARGSIDAVHDARVATRRLRELLPLLTLGEEDRKAIARPLRRATRGLGRVREQDVTLDLIGRLPATPAYPHDALELLAGAARATRARRLERIVAPRFERRLSRVVAKLARAQSALEASAAVRSEADWRRAIAARCAARAADLLEAIHDAGEVWSPERLHEVRIAVKKLRYAGELALEAAGRGPTRDIALLERAQGELGELHDLWELAQRARIARSRDADHSPLDDKLAAMTAVLDQRCLVLHRRYLRLRDALASAAESVGRAHGTRSRGRRGEPKVPEPRTG